MQRVRDKNRKKLFLLDTNGQVFRNFYAVPSSSGRQYGIPNNAVRGLLHQIYGFLREIQPEYFICIFDMGHETFRHKMYPAYKANRNAPPEELVPQFPWCRVACEALGVAVDGRLGYEADDLIASYAERYYDDFDDIYILSQDKDLFQLVNDRVHIWTWPKGPPRYEEELTKKYGLPPEKMAFFQSMKGDAVDNIPGIPGIGDKSGQVIVDRFPNIESLFQNLDEVSSLAIRGAQRIRKSLEDHRESLPMYLRLTTLCREVPDLYDLQKLKPGAPVQKKLDELTRKLEFRLPYELQHLV